MKDNFVTTFKAVLRRAMLLLVLVVAVSASASAQYVSRAEAIVRLESRSNQVQQAISTLSQNSLDYRYGVVQLFSYKAIYSELIGTNATVAQAVDKLFIELNGKSDSVDGIHATILEYNKKNPVTGFDIYEAIRKDVKQLLK